MSDLQWELADRFPPLFLPVVGFVRARSFHPHSSCWLWTQFSWSWARDPVALLSVVSILGPSPMRTILEHSPQTFPTASYRWRSSVSMPPLKAWLWMSINVKLPFLLLFQPTPPTSAQETCCFLFPLLSNAWEHGGLPVYRALSGLKKTSRRRDAPSLQEAAGSSTVLSTPFPPWVSLNTVCYHAYCLVPKHGFSIAEAGVLPSWARQVHPSATNLHP